MPEIVSVFAAHFRSRAFLFLIVKWHYYLPGVETEGDYYEVKAYATSYSPSGTLTFKVDGHLSETFGSGIDGRQEGARVRFKYKDAISIKKRLSKLDRAATGENGWQ
ncbi:hypothetical protein BX592_1104 [Paraburkholderia rhizosphaerae]|uniref:Uncharacterized protein n=1 Tax=Paraburkholderia rhizosphaerae TaxID=480658 RepID=A0A4R8LQD3_9BURK|nr:hypothetical protein BX592_1104 [Paraburkholderia rhizosphaerae]